MCDRLLISCVTELQSWVYKFQYFRLWERFMIRVHKVMEFEYWNVNIPIKRILKMRKRKVRGRPHSLNRTCFLNIDLQECSTFDRLTQTLLSLLLLLLFNWLDFLWPKQTTASKSQNNVHWDFDSITYSALIHPSRSSSHHSDITNVNRWCWNVNSGVTSWIRILRHYDRATNNNRRRSTYQIRLTTSFLVVILSYSVISTTCVWSP